MRSLTKAMPPNFDNYRGITVGLILAKLFVMILDKRLSEWAEQHGLCAKGQAGFAKITTLLTNSSYCKL
jgi:hypothetical protein